MDKPVLYILVIAVWGVMLTGCDSVDQAQPSETVTDTTRWRNLGLIGEDVIRLRYYDPYVYAFTRNHALWKRHLLLESNWTEIKFEGVDCTSFRDDPRPLPFDIVQHPDTSTRLVASFGGPCEGGPRVFASQNGGVDWYPASNGLSAVYDLIGLFYHSANTLLITGDSLTGFNGNVLVSHDFGESWQIFNKEPSILAGDVGQHPNFPNVFAGGLSKNFHIEDPLFLAFTASSWNKYNLSGLLQTNFDYFRAGTVAFDASSADVAYVGISGIEKSALMRTLDGGRSWKLVENNNCCMDILGDLTTPNQLYGGMQNKVLMSLNQGNTWTEFRVVPDSLADIQSLIWGQRASQFILGTSRGVWVLE